ncbi:hypothetical protein [Streptomyces sp. WZ-12]|uniref:hypothetical protein n=1 Tax=Streptomyces sp. WZ-12 TaxID=3030210 RepID=UPI0023816094|nr:hypothetical protein [Streptomyces sp. WZ-12]
MHGLVLIVIHPHRAAPPVQRRLHQVGHQRLAAARLPGDEHHHGALLGHRAAHGGGEYVGGQDPVGPVVGRIR